MEWVNSCMGLLSGSFQVFGLADPVPKIRYQSRLKTFILYTKIFKILKYLKIKFSNLQLIGDLAV